MTEHHDRKTTMNIQDPNLPTAKKAEVQFLDGEFRIVKHGEYVLCEVTGQRVPLEELRYWSVVRQEAYSSADVANAREQQIIKGAKA